MPPTPILEVPVTDTHRSGSGFERAFQMMGWGKTRSSSPEPYLNTTHNTTKRSSIVSFMSDHSHSDRDSGIFSTTSSNARHDDGGAGGGGGGGGGSVVGASSVVSGSGGGRRKSADSGKRNSVDKVLSGTIKSSLASLLSGGTHSHSSSSSTSPKAHSGFFGRSSMEEHPPERKRDSWGPGRYEEDELIPVLPFFSSSPPTTKHGKRSKRKGTKHQSLMEPGQLEVVTMTKSSSAGGIMSGSRRRRGSGSVVSTSTVGPKDGSDDEAQQQKEYLAEFAAATSTLMSTSPPAGGKSSKKSKRAVSAFFTKPKSGSYSSASGSGSGEKQVAEKPAEEKKHHGEKPHGLRRLTTIMQHNKSEKSSESKKRATGGSSKAAAEEAAAVADLRDRLQELQIQETESSEGWKPRPKPERPLQRRLSISSIYSFDYEEAQRVAQADQFHQMILQQSGPPSSSSSIKSPTTPSGLRYGYGPGSDIAEEDRDRNTEDDMIDFEGDFLEDLPVDTASRHTYDREYIGRRGTDSGYGDAVLSPTDSLAIDLSDGEDNESVIVDDDPTVSPWKKTALQSPTSSSRRRQKRGSSSAGKSKSRRSSRRQSSSASMNDTYPSRSSTPTSTNSDSHPPIHPNNPYIRKQGQTVEIVGLNRPVFVEASEKLQDVMASIITEEVSTAYDRSQLTASDVFDVMLSKLEGVCGARSNEAY
ncbi:hypothetical protein HK102_013820 [Quaeritorhiza haematococci]|nr:hypothetical protein HK102_013820 [Quaeritorhiza haematococci]